MYYKKNGIKFTIRKCINFLLKKDQNVIENEKYNVWIKENELAEEEIEKQRKENFEINPKISIIVPMTNPKKIYNIISSAQNTLKVKLEK